VSEKKKVSPIHPAWLSLAGVLFLEHSAASQYHRNGSIWLHKNGQILLNNLFNNGRSLKKQKA